jgi:asparagine synthase (glutamine-hydrolysing)
MLDGLPQAIAQTGSPALTDHYAYDALFKTAASAGARVIMTGEGGDFTLNSRGNGFLAWLLASGRVGSFMREFGAHRRRTGDSAWGTLRIQVLHPLLPYWMWQAWRRARGTMMPPYRKMTVAADVVRQLEASDPPFRWRDDRPPLPGPDFLARRHRALDRWMNAPTVYFADEVRDYGMTITRPFLDRRVVELGLALPHDLMVHDGWNRALARKALAAVLPPRYQTRDRSNADGVAVDAFEIHRTALADLHAEAERLRRSGACPEIDFDGLGQLLETPADAPFADDMLFHALHVVAVGRFMQWFRAPNR